MSPGKVIPVQIQMSSIMRLAPGSGEGGDVG